MPLDIPLPTDEPQDDPNQYIPLLLSAIEGFLQARDVWADVDYEQAMNYMENLKQYVVDCFGKCGDVVDIGTIAMFGAEILPGGWLLCDGAEVSRAQYANLFGMIGETWGAGDGSTTFALPDFSDYSPMGTGGIVNTIGGSYGEQWHTLTIDEMPSHNHGVTDFGHAHRIPKASATVNASVNTSSPNARTDNPATPTMSTDVGRTGISIEPRGNSASHNNVHPVRGVAFMIYAGV